MTGFLIDSGVVWLSKRNGGVYEPEFRLWFMLSMLFGVFGYVGWAGKIEASYWIQILLILLVLVGNDHKMPWIGAVACITSVSILNLVDVISLTP